MCFSGALRNDRQSTNYDKTMFEASLVIEEHCDKLKTLTVFLFRTLQNLSIHLFFKTVAAREFDLWTFFDKPTFTRTAWENEFSLTVVVLSLNVHLKNVYDFSNCFKDSFSLVIWGSKLCIIIIELISALNICWTDPALYYNFINSKLTELIGCYVHEMIRESRKGLARNICKRTMDSKFENIIRVTVHSCNSSFPLKRKEKK